jgi:hypothetical protein
MTIYVNLILRLINDIASTRKCIKITNKTVKMCSSKADIQIQNFPKNKPGMIGCGYAL